MAKFLAQHRWTASVSVPAAVGFYLLIGTYGTRGTVASFLAAVLLGCGAGWLDGGYD